MLARMRAKLLPSASC